MYLERTNENAMQRKTRSSSMKANDLQQTRLNATTGDHFLTHQHNHKHDQVKLNRN